MGSEEGLLTQGGDVEGEGKVELDNRVGEILLETQWVLPCTNDSAVPFVVIVVGPAGVGKSECCFKLGR